MEDGFVKGTCQTMCPKDEAFLRQKENLLHKLEMKEGTECDSLPKFDPEKIVKCFNRSAAGAETTKPANLRPFPVLQKTINYLYRRVFPLHKEKPVYIYNFMFDRFRAVRQDAIIQNLTPAETIKILEPIVRFLIYFGYILVEEDANEFDYFINFSHLQECLKRLLVCYDECEDTDQMCRWDIESAYILLNLGNIKALTRGIQKFQLNINRTYSCCLKLSLQWYLKNYKKVFELILELPPLLLCVVNFSIPEIRKYALQAMAYAYSSANSAYPISCLCHLLLFESEQQAEEECHHYNIRVSNGKINFLKKDFNVSVKCKQGIRLKWVDEKLLNQNIVELLCTGTLND